MVFWLSTSYGHLNFFLIKSNRQKSDGAKSGEYGWWWIIGTFSLIVLTSNDVLLFNITQMNGICFFEEVVENSFRLKIVASYYVFWTFTFTNPTSVSRLVSNLSQIKPRLIPSNIAHGLNGPCLNRAKFFLTCLRFWSVYWWDIQRDARFLF